MVDRSLIMREVPGSIPGPVKCPLPDPGYWKVAGVTQDWETTCNKYVAVGHRSFG